MGRKRSSKNSRAAAAVAKVDSEKTESEERSPEYIINVLDTFSSQLHDFSNDIKIKNQEFLKHCDDEGYVRGKNELEETVDNIIREFQTDFELIKNNLRRDNGQAKEENTVAPESKASKKKNRRKRKNKNAAASQQAGDQKMEE